MLDVRRRPVKNTQDRLTTAGDGRRAEHNQGFAGLRPPPTLTPPTGPPAVQDSKGNVRSWQLLDWKEGRRGRGWRGESGWRAEEEKKG